MINVRRITPGLTAVMPGWPIAICGILPCYSAGPAGGMAVRRKSYAWLSQRESAA
jgi:hypothetical protein